MNMSVTRRRLQLSSLLAISLSFAACNDEDSLSGSDGGIADALSNIDSQIELDAATSMDTNVDTVSVDGLDAPDAVVTTLLPFAPSGLVVLHSDYQTTSISITGLTSSNGHDDCVHSGSTMPKLTLALSGDVVLPSQPLPNKEVVVIDRSSANLSFINSDTCDVKRQIKVGTGFRANPYDFNWIAADKAYVTRFAPNPTPTPIATDFDEGNDILVFNPTTGSILGRIDLTALVVPIANKKILAQPSRMVRLGTKVYVSLGHQDATYTAASPGRIAILDTNTDAVTGFIDLPGLANCGDMQIIEPQSLVITCGGPFSAAEKQIDFSGLAMVNLSSGVVTKVNAKTFGRALSISSVAAVGDRFFAVTSGEFSGPPSDQLWTGSFSSEAPAMKFSAAESFSLGTILAHPTLPQIYVADAQVEMNKAPQVRVFSTAAAPILTQQTAISVGATKKLPVRQIAWF